MHGVQVLCPWYSYAHAWLHVLSVAGKKRGGPKSKRGKEAQSVKRRKVEKTASEDDSEKYNYNRPYCLHGVCVFDDRGDKAELEGDKAEGDMDEIEKQLLEVHIATCSV